MEGWKDGRGEEGKDGRGEEWKRDGRGKGLSAITCRVSFLYPTYERMVYCQLEMVLHNVYFACQYKNPTLKLK